jgi:hypothetical protein
MNRDQQVRIVTLQVIVLSSIWIGLGISSMLLPGILAPTPVIAGEDGPTGGGAGCQSNGNCQGTLYKDKRNLDRWWYPICSGCHTPQASAPAKPSAPLSVAQRKFIGDAKAFWALHAQAQPDPALRAMLPKSGLRPIQTLAPEFRALVKK